MCQRLFLGLGAVVLASAGSRLQAQPPPAASSYLRPPYRCPSDLQGLTTRLLVDMPSYANRVASRSLSIPLQPNIPPPNIVVLAGPPDFTPVDLADSPPGEAADRAAASDVTHQVFFTTLERQYWQDQEVLLQNYHWLFLVQYQDGWYMALMYSTLGRYPSSGPFGTQQRPPTPPQESSDGIVGQAVRLWLRDCRAGAVFSGEADALPDMPLPLNVAPLDTDP